MALKGKTIVNTRATHQAEEMNTLLRSRGAIPVNYPSIAIASPQDSTLLDTSLVALESGQFDWLVLTSANTVFAIAKRIQVLRLRLTGKLFRTAAIGTATAEAVRTRLGLEVFSLPPQFIVEALAEHLPVETGTRVLLPESAIARPTLADRLVARGAVVSVVDAYQTVCGQGGADVPQLLAQSCLDALTFTSSSTVTYFLERLDQAGGGKEDALKLCAACIGTKTAATALEFGFNVLISATEHTVNGLVEALDTYFAQRTETEK